MFSCPRRSVDGPSQFSFYGLSYTAWPLSRFAHSRLPSSVNECRIVTSGGSENNNASSPAAASNGCARRSGSDVIADDDADDDQASCLTLDIFTSSVVYDELAPVVVVLAGEEDDGIEPNSGSLIRILQSYLVQFSMIMPSFIRVAPCVSRLLD